MLDEQWWGKLKKKKKKKKKEEKIWQAFSKCFHLKAKKTSTKNSYPVNDIYYGQQESSFSWISTLVRIFRGAWGNYELGYALLNKLLHKLKNACECCLT